MFARVFVVQDIETACFLCPHTGDVGLTAWINDAGLFVNEEEAVETAASHCSDGFKLFSFFKLLEETSNQFH